MIGSGQASSVFANYFLQTRQADRLARSMVWRHFHLQILARIPQILGSQHRAFLANEQGSLWEHVSLVHNDRWGRSRTYAEGVATNVVWADGKVRDLEVLHPVHIQTFIQNTMFDDRIAFFGRHAARA